MRNFYKQKLLVLVFLLGPVGFSLAQDFLPALSDNYMGINQVFLQPAAIADSRFKLDINVFGFNNDIYNDMIRFKSAGVLNPFSILTDNNWWEDNSYMTSPNDKDKTAFVSQSVLGPGFLISIGQKQAFGFTSRLRNIVNADDLSEPLSRSIYEDFTDPFYWDKWYHDENLRVSHHMFVDYGLSYATELVNTGANFLKAGVTVKLLQGLGAAYVQSEDFYYYFHKQDETGNDADYMSWNSPYANSGVSGNWGGYDDNGKYKFYLDYKFAAKPSVGLDLGVVYELRPKYKDYRYNMDGQTDLEMKNKNKYLLKIGVSVLDIGRLRYEKEYKSTDFTAAFSPNYINNDTLNTHWMDIEEVHFGFPPYVNFADTVNERINNEQGMEKGSKNEDIFTVKLPTALSLQVDVKIVSGLYVNLTTFTGLNQGYSKVNNSHYMSNYSITPRFESKWFTVSVPLQYNQFQKFNVGLGVRAAFAYFGINNIFSGLFSDPYGSSIYLGVKIPFFQGKPPADRDNDGVSDKKDKCPTTPGLWEFYGCPDRDGDGVADSEDACPDIPGLKEFLGCPDTDGDGVSDLDDKCPNVPGPKITNGCPDRDNDGVVDDQDECPDAAGPVELVGCPDSDGDGVPDIKDNCPDLSGLVEYAGCPFLDTDGDGVKDADDMCPDKKGPPENNGCPYSDSDGDGVVDKEDRCPLTPGDPTNFGCPVIKAEEAAVLKTAFENLEFETAKAVIRSSSFASMDELAALLISKPTWKLKISGHTDNVGSDEYNMNLSKNRAQATAKYLQGKGVPPSQLLPEWFGETKPIADNDTPEGRQTNRRVEMQVVFD